jgi:purine-nucleoside phosphorylase
VFYDPDPTAFATWKKSGHIAVEMEAAMMYTIAAINGLEALAVMTVTDLLGDDGSTVRISDEDLARGVESMMRVACRVAIS